MFNLLNLLDLLDLHRAERMYCNCGSNTCMNKIYRQYFYVSRSVMTYWLGLN